MPRPWSVRSSGLERSIHPGSGYPTNVLPQRRRRNATSDTSTIYVSGARTDAIGALGSGRRIKETCRTVTHRPAASCKCPGSWQAACIASVLWRGLLNCPDAPRVLGLIDTGSTTNTLSTSMTERMASRHVRRKYAGEIGFSSVRADMRRFSACQLPPP